MMSPTWERAGRGRYRLVTDERFPRIVGDVEHTGSRWLARTNNMNGTGFYDETDRKTLREAKAWVERHGR